MKYAFPLAAMSCSVALGFVTPQAADANFSGTVLDIYNKPISGVVVSLLRTGATATTDASGAWSMTTVTNGIAPSQKLLSKASGHLQLEKGHLQLHFDGINVAGQRMHLTPAFSTSAPASAARAQGHQDTLTYSLGGKVRLRDTLTVAQTGMVRILDTTFNPSVVYGYLNDARDGQTYRTVTLGNQVWMVQNLNYKPAGSDSGWCYGNKADSCANWGRLYSWSEAMAVGQVYDSTLRSGSDVNQQGICPNGWHVPSSNEWLKLTDTTLSSISSGVKLQSTHTHPIVGRTAGTDAYGFNVRTSGYLNLSYGFIESDRSANFWVATELTATAAKSQYFYNIFPPITYDTYNQKKFGLSLRCLKSAGAAANVVPKLTYALTVTAAHGTVSLDPSKGPYDSGATVKVKITPHFSYTFDGWSGAYSGTTDTCTVTMSDNKTLTALFTEKPKGPGMKLIPGGTFTMGSPATEVGRRADEVQHSVTLSAFYMDSTEVTQDQYYAVTGANPSTWTSSRIANLPVENLTWFDAVLYCNARSKAAGLDTVYSYTEAPVLGHVKDLTGLAVSLDKNGYRLPTEAQWEFAMRGGTTTAYYWGDDTASATVCKYSCFYYNVPVAKKLPNAYGLYDMAGRTAQWMGDWYGPYPTTAQTDPSGPVTGSFRIFRGSDWSYPTTSMRSAYRGYMSPYSYDSEVGFRCVRPLP